MFWGIIQLKTEMQTRSRKKKGLPQTPERPQIPVKVPPKANPKAVPKASPTPPIILDNTSEEALNKQLKELYEDVKSTPNYSAKITNFLRSYDVHSKHRRITKKTFPRRRVIARFPFELFMADLIEYQEDRFINRGYKFILLMIDCFTKMIYVAPMKRKTKEWSADAFESIFKKLENYPVNLVTDGGLEFFNSSVQKIFETYGINHYKTPTKTKMKASIAERAIRTIKNRLEKYFRHTGKRKWIDVIDHFVANYNKTPHRSIGMPPQDVNDENRDEVYKKLYPLRNLTVVCRLQLGDKVRKIVEKKDFEKGYTQNWSDEIYEIATVQQSNTVCFYKLKHLNGEKITGIYYYYQLNLVSRQ